MMSVDTADPHGSEQLAGVMSGAFEPERRFPPVNLTTQETALEQT